MEGVLPLLLFAKEPVRGTWTGITHDNYDKSVDTIRDVVFPLLAHWGVEGASLRVTKRGAAPSGGGAVSLVVPTVRELKPVQLVEEGYVKRVRGVTVTTKVSPSIANRIVDAIRGVFNDYIPDVYIHTDVHRGATSGHAPSYGVSLSALTTAGVVYSAEAWTPPAEHSPEYAEGLPAAPIAEAVAVAANGPQHAGASGAAGAGLSVARVPPEDLGVYASQLLLERIAGRGCIDLDCVSLALTLCALSSEDVSKLRLPLTLPNSAIATLRLLREFFAVTFKFREEAATGGTVVVSCLGCGFKNTAKKVT